jgi:drug/metabolite transporter (DMT)-like permease
VVPLHRSRVRRLHAVAETLSAAAVSGRPTLWPGLAFALAGSIAFSGKAIIVKLAYRHGVDAVTLLMLRMLFALPLFVGLAWWASRDKPALTRRDLVAVLGLGFSGYYLASFLDLNPTLVLFLGVVLHGKRVTRRQLTALGVSYSGVLVVFGRELTDLGPHVGLGAALVFASALSYAVYPVQSGQEVNRLGALRLTGLATTVACVLCIGQFVVLRPVASVLVVPTPVLWLSVLNATACTFAPVILVMLGIERLGAGLAAQTGLVGPMSTVLMSVFILGEPMTVWIAIGTLLVLAGVALLARWR